jgi:hypothetical protein
MPSSRSLFWAAFAVFVACALYINWHDDLFAFRAPLAPAKLSVWLAFAGLAALLWAVPTLAFANLSILLYFAIHFDAIVARFMA